MKKLGIYVNKKKENAFKITEQLLLLADELGFVCKILSSPVLEKEKLEFAKEVDAIIVLGGDGTILRIASAAARANTPLLAVNLGHLGFLTEVETDGLEKALKLIKEEKFVIEERMMLACYADNEEFLALNDVYLQRASEKKLLNLEVYAGEEFVDSLSADGVLVSSPTGSTAYSLSAGGPIISPKVSVLLMTPVCAHTLRARPIVFKDDEKLKFFAKDETGFSVVLDGNDISHLKGAREIEVSRSSASVKFITFAEKRFFTRLNSKLIEWNRGGNL